MPWAYGPSFYFAVLDKNTAMMSEPLPNHETHEAMQKAAGKRTTDVQSKRMKELLANADPDKAAEWFASGEMTISLRQWVDESTRTIRFRHITLEAGGAQRLCGNATIREAGLTFKTTAYAADTASAKDLQKKIDDGLAGVIADLTKQSENHAELKPVVEAMKKVKVATADDAVILEGGATADAAATLINTMGTVSLDKIKAAYEKLEGPASHEPPEAPAKTKPDR